MNFQLVPKSVTLNDLEQRNGVILRYFSDFGWLPGAPRKSARLLSHLLVSSCLNQNVIKTATNCTITICGRQQLVYCNNQVKSAWMQFKQARWIINTLKWQLQFITAYKRGIPAANIIWATSIGQRNSQRSWMISNYSVGHINSICVFCTNKPSVWSHTSHLPAHALLCYTVRAITVKIKN